MIYVLRTVVQPGTKSQVPSESVAARHRCERVACLDTGGSEDLPLRNEMRIRLLKELLSFPKTKSPGHPGGTQGLLPPFRQVLILVSD